MQNLIYNEQTYNNIFFYTDDTLIKYSRLSIELWEELKIKNLYYLNTPFKVENLTEIEKITYPEYKSKIYLPFLNGFKTFSLENYTRNLSTKEILLILKKNLQLIKDMHKNNVIHADLHPDNIMINNTFDIRLIDLDYSIINDNEIPEDNIYYNYSIPYSRKRSLTRIQDKIDILDLYMYYLVNGKFKEDTSLETDLSSLNLKKYIKEEINAHINYKSKPNRNYYFIDIVDELIYSDFTSDVLEKRKVLKDV